MRGKWYEETQAALALVAAVVGAGFASGREVLRFFTVFGPWSWVGCVLAAAVLAALAACTALLSDRLGAFDLGTLCRRALGGFGGVLAAWLNGALVTVTSGAMIAAMGELAALALPIQRAYAVGVVAATVLAVLLARGGISAIAAVGGWLLPLCLVLYALLLNSPAEAEKAAAPVPHGAWKAAPMALAYAAMNAALAGGVLCEMGQGRSRKSILRASAMMGGMLLLLLCGANAALYAHVGTLGDAALPVVMLARRLGATGYWLCIAVLSLAVMTTLVALVRTLARMLQGALPARYAGVCWPLSTLLPLLVGLTGFEALVSGVYPLLGAASTLLFLGILSKPRRAKAE